MKKILLVCATGMSTGMLVEKMNQAAEKMQVEIDILAVSESAVSESLDGVDIILLGPQVRFMEQKIKDISGNVPVNVINMLDYGMMDGKKVLTAALETIEKKES